ncbi:hypothetical protein CVT30_30920 [Streptomyces sp. AMCC400023]|nr:hypothetical protein CVT30_30920 [Streptomyces sp. AMCC400023]
MYRIWSESVDPSLAWQTHRLQCGFQGRHPPSRKVSYPLRLVPLRFGTCQLNPELGLLSLDPFQSGFQYFKFSGCRQRVISQTVHPPLEFRHGGLRLAQGSVEHHGDLQRLNASLLTCFIGMAGTSEFLIGTNRPVLRFDHLACGNNGLPVSQNGGWSLL